MDIDRGVKLVITSKDVFAKRKNGDLNDAYNMALELINNPGRDDWDIKAFAWCVIDLIKRDTKSGQQKNLNHYAQQLENLKIDSSDSILSDQRQYTLKLCKPSGQDVLKAKALSKQGHHLESIDLFREVLSNGDDSEDVQTGLAWGLYRIAKSMIEQDPPNFIGAKRYLNDYFKLKTEKPSLLHTCILQLADKLAKEGKLNMGAFARIWDLSYLRSDDYEPFTTNDGNVYPSIAERVVQHASKDAFLRNAQDDLLYILPFINDCINKFPYNLWLKLSKARTLMGIGRNDEALSFGLEVVKSKVNDYWAWELLGDIHKPSSSIIALSCYCKALLCSKDINFLSKVKIKLAELLIEKNDYSQAKFEIEEIINYRLDNNQKVPEIAELFRGQTWYEKESAATSNRELYQENSPMAEELLYSDLPWISGVLGDVFTIDAKPNKPKRKLYIQSKPVPLEISISESKVLLSEPHSGMGIRIKGAYDNEKRFQLYTLESRHAPNKWDIFDEYIGVVDHVNKEKNLLHFIVNRNIDGVIRFSDLQGRYDEGEAIAVRVSKYINKHGEHYRTLTSCKTAMPIPESLVKPFEDNVREENGMGFTDNGIFIPPPMVKTYAIKNEDYVSGKAVLSYNKKKSDWSWKAISIDNVCSTFESIDV
jgi:tetratricopeptide (TPR) repeat protein